MATAQGDGPRSRTDAGRARAGGAGAAGLVARLALLVAAGCVADRERGYPLYPAGEPEPTRAEVAVLTGYVRTVDGEDVSRLGSTFRLLPGCHRVGTPPAWGHTEPTQGAVVVKTGEVSFALPMRAGFTYVVEVEAERRSTLVGGARVVARERGPDGAVTREFAPLTAAQGAASCPAEAPGRGVTPR